MSNFCSQCGAPIKEGATKCEYCGATVAKAAPQPAPQAKPQVVYVQQPAADSRANLPAKSRIGAALFAFFLGSFGVHKFYLGRTFAGIMYLLFFWTYIPTILSILDFVTLLCMSDDNFCKKYNCRVG